MDQCRSAAREAFDAARQIAAELACGVESELGRRLGKLEGLLAAGSAASA